MEKQYYTVQECAYIYEVCDKTVYNWIDDGIIEACRPGGRVYRIDIRSCDNLSAPVRNQPKPKEKCKKRSGLHPQPKFSPGKRKVCKPFLHDEPS